MFNSSTPTHGRAKAGWPAWTYIQQLCEDTGCCPEDLPRAMNDREEWRERVRDIRATSATWWWWWDRNTWNHTTVCKLFVLDWNTVTYWPSTQPSIEKLVHPVKDITLTCRRVEFGTDARPTRSRWMSNNYITRCHRRFELVVVSCCWSSSCSLRQWEPASSRRLGPSRPPVEQPSRMRKKCCYSQRNWGSISCSLFSLQLTSNT